MVKTPLTINLDPQEDAVLTVDENGLAEFTVLDADANTGHLDCAISHDLLILLLDDTVRTLAMLSENYDLIAKMHKDANPSW